MWRINLENKQKKRSKEKYYYGTKENGFYGIYKNEKEEGRYGVNVWNFHNNPILVRCENSEENKHKPTYSLQKQFSVIRKEQVVKFERLSGVDLSKKENILLFDEIFSPTMIFHNSVDKKKCFDILRNFHQISFFSMEKLEENMKKCDDVRNQMIEHKKKVLLDLENVLEGQINLFEKSVIGKLKKRKELLQAVDSTKLEKKVKRRDVTLLTESEQTPLTRIIMECGDALNIIFSFINSRDLILNFSPSCSMFIYLIHHMPLKFVIDERDMFLYHIEDLLREYHIHDLTIVKELKSRKKRGFMLGSFKNEKSLKKFSEIITSRKQQLRYLTVNDSVLLKKDQNQTQDVDTLVDFNLTFYDMINECERLETFNSDRFIPKDMTNLRNLKKLEFITEGIFSLRDAQSLNQYFSSDERPKLTHLKLGNCTEKFSSSYVESTKNIYDKKLGRQKMILEYIPQSCTNLKSIEVDLFFGLESYSDAFMEFLASQSSLDDIILLYKGSGVHCVVEDAMFLEYQNMVYAVNKEEQDRRKLEAKKELRKRFSKVFEKNKHKLEFFQDVMLKNNYERKSKMNKIVIRCKPNLSGEMYLSFVHVYDNLYEKLFIFELMRIPDTILRFGATSNVTFGDGERSLQTYTDFFSFHKEVMCLGDIRCKSINMGDFFFKYTKTPLVGTNFWNNDGTGYTGWGTADNNNNNNNNNNEEEEEEEDLEGKKKKLKRKIIKIEVEEERYQRLSGEFLDVFDNLFKRSVFLEEITACWFNFNKATHIVKVLPFFNQPFVKVQPFYFY